MDRAGSTSSSMTYSAHQTRQPRTAETTADVGRISVDTPETAQLQPNQTTNTPLYRYRIAELPDATACQQEKAFEPDELLSGYDRRG